MKQAIATLLWLAILASLPACQFGGPVANKPSPSPSRAPTPVASPSPSPAATRPPDPPTQLSLSGSLATSTDPAAGPNSCAFGQPEAGKVRLTTAAMPLAGGAVARVVIIVAPRAGAQPADAPAADGLAAVRIVRSSRPAGGQPTTWVTTSGTVTVALADNVGSAGTYGRVAGTVDASLTLIGDGQPAQLSGSWGCVIEPVANGG